MTGFSEMALRGSVRMSPDEHGRAQTSPDKPGRARTSPDEPDKHELSQLEGISPGIILPSK